jgi:hypothetical protein
MPFKKPRGIYGFDRSGATPTAARHPDRGRTAAAAPYRGPKGDLSFPRFQPLPLALIGKVAVALAAQYADE